MFVGLSSAFTIWSFNEPLTSNSKGRNKCVFLKIIDHANLDQHLVDINSNETCFIHLLSL